MLFRIFPANGSFYCVDITMRKYRDTFLFQDEPLYYDVLVSF